MRVREGDNESEREKKNKNALQMWENGKKDIFSRKTIKKIDHQ